MLLKTKAKRISELKELYNSVCELISVIQKTNLYYEYIDELKTVSHAILHCLDHSSEQKDLREIYDNAPRILYTFPGWLPPGGLNTDGKWEYPDGYLLFEKQYEKMHRDLNKMIETGEL